MKTFIIRKIIILIPMLLAISFLVFLVMELTPGDALSYMANPELVANMNPEEIEELREYLGLNDPMVVRYFKWLGGVLQGNWGYSLGNGQSVMDMFLDRLPATFELALASLLISSVIGIAFGVISAVKKGTAIDSLLTFGGMVGISVPEFFFGILLIFVFGINLDWFPIGGRSHPDYTSYWQTLTHLVMPATVLSIVMVASLMRYTRATVLDTLNKEYIKTAIGKGLPKHKVYIVHGLRSSMAPIIIVIGFRIPMLIGGATVIETVFTRPGVGLMFVNAIRGQDYPIVLMVLMLVSSLVLVSSFLMDILTAVIDPRIKLE